METSARTVMISTAHYYMQRRLHTLCHLTSIEETGSEMVCNLSKVTQQVRL